MLQTILILRANENNKMKIVRKRTNNHLSEDKWRKPNAKRNYVKYPIVQYYIAYIRCCIQKQNIQSNIPNNTIVAFTLFYFGLLRLFTPVVPFRSILFNKLLKLAKNADAKRKSEKGERERE